jgi:hypothetical protein
VTAITAAVVAVVQHANALTEKTSGDIILVGVLAQQGRNSATITPRRYAASLSEQP